MKEEEKTKEQLINELVEMRQWVAELEASETERKRAEEALRKHTHDLGERVKELNCLYDISKLVADSSISLQEILQGTVDLIPPTWQYPEVTCARITLEHQEFRTENFRETIWKQTGDIIVHGERIGTVEVCYLEERPESDGGPFLKEERSLLNIIAERLGTITERKRVEGALRESEERYRTIVEDMPALVCRFLPDGVLTFVNKHYCRYFNKRREELEGHNFFQFIPEEERKKVREHYASLTIENPVITYEHKVLAPDRTVRWQLWTDRALFDERGHPVEYQSIGEDITERVLTEEELAYMATHDPLTGLPNRMLFSDRLTLALAHAHRNQRKLSVMLLDLDQFKEVNDTLGHSVGDKLLQAVGKRLTSLLRKSDTAARMGGDEFLLLLPEIAGCEDVAKVAQEILEAIRRPFVFDGQEIHTTISIGIAMYPDDGEDADTLMKNADIAMYRAKDRGRDNYRHYSG